jgi:Transposase, Mutator family
VWPKTRGQRCWVHKTANVLNKLPKSQQAKAKRALQEIWMAETKKDALVAFDAFIETWGLKYAKAVECLTKDRDALLAFYDFAAEHWKHLRTTDEMDKPFFGTSNKLERDEMDKPFFGTSNKLEKSAASPFFCSTAPPPFFRPDHHLARRRAQGQSRLAASAATGRLGLDWPEHGGILDRM